MIEEVTSQTRAVIFVMWHENVDSAHFEKEFAGFEGEVFFLQAALPGVPKNTTIANNLHEAELPNADLSFQRRRFFAPSMILNVFKSGIFEKYSHVGFVEYDVRLNADARMTPVAAQLNFLARNEHESKGLGFSCRRPIRNLYEQSDITIRGVNAILYLHEKLSGTTGVPLNSLLDKLAVTQQSFFVSSVKFIDIVGPILRMAESGVFEKGLNTWHRPSTLLERAFAVQLALQLDAIEPANADHQSEQKWKDSILLGNFFKFFASYFRRRIKATRVSANSWRSRK